MFVVVDYTEPQRLEVEMVDADDIEEGSEMYSAAQQAKEKAKGTIDGQPSQKAILAVVVGIASFFYIKLWLDHIQTQNQAIL